MTLFRISQLKAKDHGDIDAVTMRLATKTSAFNGGYYRGPLLGLIIWYRFDDIISSQYR